MLFGEVLFFVLNVFLVSPVVFCFFGLSFWLFVFFVFFRFDLVFRFEFLVLGEGNFWLAKDRITSGRLKRCRRHHTPGGRGHGTKLRCAGA